MSTITLAIEGKVAHLTINRAEKYNALTQSMWQAISDSCDQLKNELKPKVLVISGAGEKAFSAGADIQELRDIIQDPQRLQENNNIVQLAQKKLESLPFATIAKINGVCVGGGMGIALSCDFRVCDDKATFAITPSKLGLLYSIEDTRRLVNIVGLPRAKELLYLGKKISGDTAENWGVVTESTSSERLEEAVTDLTQELLNVSSCSVAGMKQTLAYLSGSGDDNEREIRALFEHAFSQPDFIEGANAFMHKRKPEFN